jgi:pantoate--beta-alanine ligase
MELIKSINEAKHIFNTLESRRIGFVPTMGAFHKGHLTLIEKSLSENEITVVSIFVNPTQFNDKSDLENYPKTIEEDITALMKLNVDYLFLPKYTEMYPDNFTFKIEENSFSNELCGAKRPGHFTGVLTVVMKLFNVVKPGRAYFGEKDYQQLQLIKGMVDAFFLDITIVTVPTVREKDGLAMSSRNLLLTDAQRKVAPDFYRLLKSNLDIETIKQELTSLGFGVDYIEEKFGRRFGAVFLGNVRLIDNVEIETKS